MSGNAQENDAAESGPIWIPLESDPDIMTEYLNMITLDSTHYLIDVPVIDGAEEMGIFAGHNVKAFIFLYEINDNTASEIAEAASQSSGPDLFHMKQLVRNACGSIALFHAYINTVNPKQILSQTDSIMHKFYQASINENFEKRGQLFSESQEISDMHHSQALQGQSGVPNEEELNKINYHFVAIVYKDGSVVKLDGRCQQPVKMGECAEDGFKAAGLDAIKTMIQRDPNNYNFSILAFCGPANN